MAFTPATMLIFERLFLYGLTFFLGIFVYVLYKQNKQVEAVLIAIIGSMAMFYYWIKWFKIAQADSVWPPYISPCPDYLSLISPAVTGDNIPVCMDFIGVSTIPQVFKLTDRNNIPKVTDSRYEEHAFIVPPRGDTSAAEYNKAMCNKVKSAGLTWEGVCE
jgi:hypothetical protein